MAEVRSGGDAPRNPLDPGENLKDPSNTDTINSVVHPQVASTTEDSAVTKAEKVERHGVEEGVEDSPSKRRKLDVKLENGVQNLTKSERKKGVAPIKSE